MNSGFTVSPCFARSKKGLDNNLANKLNYPLLKGGPFIEETKVSIGLLVIIVVVLALRSNYAVDLMNSYKPKATFEKTVLNKINKNEVSSLYFYQGDNTDNPIIITERSKINDILNVLLPIELKEKRNTPSSSEFHINIELNGKITFFTSFSNDESELYINDLSDVKKITNKKYSIIKNYDRNKLKALLGL